ncbi:zinc finger CCCH domain-containing protein 13-like protein [Tanacetum coccineum]
MCFRMLFETEELTVRSQATYAIEILKKRLGSKSPNIQLLSLSVKQKDIGSRRYYVLTRTCFYKANEIVIHDSSKPLISPEFMEHVNHSCKANSYAAEGRVMILKLVEAARKFLSEVTPHLCFNGEKMLKPGNESETHFGNGQCKKPLPQSRMLSIGMLFPPEHLEVLEDNLDWEDITRA